MKRRKIVAALFAVFAFVAGAAVACAPGCSLVSPSTAATQPGLNTARAVLAAREAYQLTMSQLILLRQEGVIDDNKALAVDAVNTVFLDALDRASADAVAGKDADALDALGVVNDALAQLAKYLTQAKDAK